MPPRPRPGPPELRDAEQEARLVTIEGIDGAGKSTLIPLLKAALNERGIDAIFTREETATPIGDAVRAAVHDHADPLAILLLFLADRAQHLADLAEPLAAGRLVVSDRYHDSTRAYQSVALRDRFPDANEFDEWLADLTKGWLVTPRRTYLLDIDPELSMKRLESRETNAAYEKLEFLRRVRARYLEIAKQEPARWVVLDAGKDPTQLAREVVEDLEQQTIAGPGRTVKGDAHGWPRS